MISSSSRDDFARPWREAPRRGRRHRLPRGKRPLDALQGALGAVEGCIEARRRPCVSATQMKRSQAPGKVDAARLTDNRTKPSASRSHLRPNPLTEISCSRPNADSPTPFAPWRWMPSRPPIAAIPACRWAWPTPPPRLFTQHLKFDPADPHWPDRDRFVLSAGHGSMLIYALLHLTGYAQPTMDDIRNFRQLGSPCAGHPGEFRAAGRRGDHRPAGAGPGDGGRHGDRRAAPERPFTATNWSTTAPGCRRRRLPDGRHQP